jgi:hypothetical protein
MYSFDHAWLDGAGERRVGGKRSVLALERSWGIVGGNKVLVEEALSTVSSSVAIRC